MWVESEPGQGSRFHFTTRFGRPLDAPVQPAPVPVNLKDLPVLAVDDNATNRRIPRGIPGPLEMKTGAGRWRSRGPRELRRAATAGRPFPLVLLDAMMPEVDGFTLARRIKEDPNLSGVVIMMLSSSGQAEDSARCRAVGDLCLPHQTDPSVRTARSHHVRVGRQQRTSQPIAAPAPNRPCGSPRPLRLLLAEDNLVNQRLAVRILEKWATRSRWPARA